MYDPQNPPIMKCGHAANSLLDGQPACATHAMTGDDATTVDENAPSLEGRQMRCTYDRPGSGVKERSRTGTSGRIRVIHADGDSVKPTDRNAAFLELKPEEGWGPKPTFGSGWDPYDRYYCGCWGWN